MLHTHTHTHTLANYLTLRMSLRPEKFTLSSSQPVPSVSWLRELYYGLNLRVCVSEWRTVCVCVRGCVHVSLTMSSKRAENDISAVEAYHSQLWWALQRAVKALNRKRKLQIKLRTADCTHTLTHTHTYSVYNKANKCLHLIRGRGGGTQNSPNSCVTLQGVVKCCNSQIISQPFWWVSWELRAPT